VATTHREQWPTIQLPALGMGRRRRAARLRRELNEVEGFLNELHTDLADDQSTLVGALERYRRKLRSHQPY
jgi:hypothetical protein